MKKKIGIALSVILLGLMSVASAQTLSFCEKVDASGNPVNPNSQFTIPAAGGPVTLVFKLPEGVKLSTVNFDLYKIENNKEVYQSTMKQPIEGTRKSVSKKVTFYDAGKYRIYVFDDQDKQLGRGEILIRKGS